MADRAYEIVTKKDPSKDTSFPRPHADKLGLFYDSGTDMTGTEWRNNDELPKIVPLLCKKYPGNKTTHNIVLAKVWLDASTISNSKNPSSGSGRTNNFQHQILTSTKQFKSAAVVGGRNSNSKPSSILCRWAQLKTRCRFPNSLTL